MNQRKLFYEHIRMIMLTQDRFIYKSNLELFKTFYDFLYDQFLSEELCKQYLKMFKSIEDVTPSKIEENFSSIIINFTDVENFIPEKFKKSGIYFIYDSSDTILYVGKTENLHKRAFQSFLNKQPYGSQYLKVLPLPSKAIEIYEAISIDYFLPFYNNKFEDISDVSHRAYSMFVEKIKTELNKSEKHSFEKVSDYAQSVELSVFDKLSENFNI